MYDQDCQIPDVVCPALMFRNNVCVNKPWKQQGHFSQRAPRHTNMRVSHCKKRESRVITTQVAHYDNASRALSKHETRVISTERESRVFATRISRFCIANLAFLKPESRVL